MHEKKRIQNHGVVAKFLLKTVICISVCRLKDKLSPSSSAEENRETELLVQVSQDSVQSTPSEFSTFEIQVSINKLFNCSSLIHAIFITTCDLKIVQIIDESFSAKLLSYDCNAPCVQFLLISKDSL